MQNELKGGETHISLGREGTIRHSIVILLAGSGRM